MNTGTSLVAQWLRIHLPMQGTWVQALVQEDPTCHRATKPCAPQLLSLRSRAREPQLLNPQAATTEACAPRVRAPQQEKPLQWEAHTPQWRAAPLEATRESPCAATRPNTAKKNKKQNKQSWTLTPNGPYSFSRLYSEPQPTSDSFTQWITYLLCHR